MELVTPLRAPSLIMLVLLFQPTLTRGQGDEVCRTLSVARLGTSVQVALGERPRQAIHQARVAVAGCGIGDPRILQVVVRQPGGAWGRPVLASEDMRGLLFEHRRRTWRLSNPSTDPVSGTYVIAPIGPAACPVTRASPMSATCVTSLAPSTMR